MILQKNIASNSKDQQKELLDAKIKKSLNSLIAYGLTTAGLLILGLYLNSQSSIDQSEIMQYSRSIIFALTLPFAIAITSSYFDYQSLQDFSSSAKKSNNKDHDLHNKKIIDFYHNDDKKIIGNKNENPVSINSAKKSKTSKT
jgi:hypothetical protein